MERPTRAKIEGLTAEIVLLRGDNETLRSKQAILLDENDALRARVARLEDALKTISTMYWHDAPAPEEMREIARRALEEK